MKVALKKVGKPMELVDVSDKYRSDCVKRLCDFDCAEFVELGEWLFLAVDEEGLLKDLPTNFLLPMQSPWFHIQKMVGNAVFVRVKPVNFDKGEIWDLEVDNLTGDDVVLIDKILSEDYQAKLREKFGDY